MKSCIDHILKEIGLETPDIEPIDKRTAFQLGMIQGNEKPIKGICGKSCFSSESKCDSAIKKRLKQGFGGTSFLRSYFCDECSAWHMSSSNNKKNK